MKLSFACYPCLLKQVIDTTELLGFNDRQTKCVVDNTLQYLLDCKQDIMPLHIVAWLYTFIHQTFYNSSDTFDPYKHLKHETNSIALKYFTNVEDIDTFDNLNFSIYHARNEPACLKKQYGFRAVHIYICMQYCSTKVIRENIWTQ